MNSKVWAAVTGVSYVTARRRYAAGTLPVPTYRLGRLITVGEPLTGASPDAGQVVVHDRVSSAGQKPDLAVLSTGELVPNPRHLATQAGWRR